MKTDEDKLLPIRILHDFVDRIESLKIPYMLSGSMAMMNYSVYRYTADIDVVIEITSRDATQMISAFEPDYYVPHDSVFSAILREQMFNVIHVETAFKVDCIVRKSSVFQRSVFSRRGVGDFYGKPISIITKEDLILSKLLWAIESHSEKQLTDVKNLMRAGYDNQYVKTWAEMLDLTELLGECESEIDL